LEQVAAVFAVQGRLLNGTGPPHGIDRRGLFSRFLIFFPYARQVSPFGGKYAIEMCVAAVFVQSWANREVAMKRVLAFGFWGLLIVAVSTGNARSSVTLGSLLAGGSLQSQDKIWTNWTDFQSIVTGLTSPADPNHILVDLDTSDPLNPCLLFSVDDPFNDPALSAAANSSQFTSFRYDVFTMNGDDLIHDNSLHLTGAGATPGGSVVINEQKFDENGLPVASLHVELTAIAQGNTIFIGDDHAVFPPQDFLRVFKEINIRGGLENFPGRDFAAIAGSFEQCYSQVVVPESASVVVWLLLGLTMCVYMKQHRLLLIPHHRAR
jgi:hypothetical protein